MEVDAGLKGIVVLVYLNNAATSWPKPEVVYRVADKYLRSPSGTPGRVSHEGDLAVGRSLLETRELLAALFGTEKPENIVFTANATEGLNLVIMGLLEPGDHVVASSMEHNSVARPLYALQEKGVEVSVVECGSDGALDPDAVKRAITARTKLICLTHASNVTGTIMPIDSVGLIAKEHGAYFLVDAAQTAGEIPINVERSYIDFLVFTGHKGLFGPPGTGGVYLRRPEVVRPLKYGGTGSRSELLIQPQILPDRFESGTLNFPGIAGLGAGVKFILKTGLDVIRKHNQELTAMLLDGLKTIPGVITYGPNDVAGRVPVISINIKGVSPGEAGTWLAHRYGVVTRSGLHCAPLAHKTIGTLKTGTLRLSMSFFNTSDDVDLALKALRELVREIRKG